MALIICRHCSRNVNTQHTLCPYCGKSVTPVSAILADRCLGATELVGGLVYFTGLAWMALDPARPSAAVVAAVLGGAAFLAGRLLRR